MSLLPQSPRLEINTNECESDYATNQSGLSPDSGARQRSPLRPRRARVSSRRLWLGVSAKKMKIIVDRSVKIGKIALMPRVSDMKKRLTDAALDLMWENSYGTTSVDSICERDGAKKGSFYYFFKSKSELTA